MVDSDSFKFQRAKLSEASLHVEGEKHLQMEQYERQGSWEFMTRTHDKAEAYGNWT